MLALEGAQVSAKDAVFDAQRSGLVFGEVRTRCSMHCGFIPANHLGVQPKSLARRAWLRLALADV